MHFSCSMSPSTVLSPFLVFPLGGKGEGAISGTCEPPYVFPRLCRSIPAKFEINRHGGSGAFVSFIHIHTNFQLYYERKILKVFYEVYSRKTKTLVATFFSPYESYSITQR